MVFRSSCCIRCVFFCVPSGSFSIVRGLFVRIICLNSCSVLFVREIICGIMSALRCLV